MRLDVEITIFCEKIQRGCSFRAFFFDLITEQFYGGGGDTPLEALAWCMDEYLARTVHGFPISPARNGNATPGSRFKNPPTLTFAAPTLIAAEPTTKTRSRKRGKKAA